MGLGKATGTIGAEDVKWQQQLLRRRKGEMEEASPVIQDLLVLQMLPVLEIHIVQSEQWGRKWEKNPTGRE